MTLARWAAAGLLSFAAAAEPNRLDGLVEAYQQKAGVPESTAVSDAVFARRVYLDAWGLLPPPEELRAFVADRSRDKRAKLVDRLLQNSERYAEHWISFWNDLLRNDEGVVYHGGRKSITAWLRRSLERNKPYDRMVEELIDPPKDAGSEGFLVGVNWRGDVSASQTPVMQAAMNSAQVFLGVNLKCAACHDSFVSKWKLRQTYGLAAFFADGPLKLVRCDVELDETAKVEFLFPELGGAPTDASLEERRGLAAKLFTDARNERLPRTMVNRVWKQLFGRGLVEPVDEMEQKPWSPELLAWLAEDFRSHGYDLKHLLRTLMNSRAYQQPAELVETEEAGGDVFRGPRLRRLSAEQFMDGISQVTGEWRIVPSRQAGASHYGRDWQLKSSSLTRALGRPIRDQVYTTRETKPTTTLQALEMVNGGDLARVLRRGALRMTGGLPKAPGPLWDSGTLGSGAKKQMPRIALKGAKRVWLVLEDMESYDPKRVVAGWIDVELERGNGRRVPLSSLRADREFRVQPLETREERNANTVVAGFPARLAIETKGFTAIRGAVGVESQPSTVGILPSVRFFVFGEEPADEEFLPAAGEPPVRAPARILKPDRLIQAVWLQAYSRPPEAAELAAARQMLGTRVNADGLEDLLWSVFLSPEFQFIQ